MQLAESHDLVVTVEENAIMGGAGSAINELLAENNVVMPVLNLGIQDQYIEHGKPDEMLDQCGLNAKGIERSIRGRLAAMEQNPANLNVS